MKPFSRAARISAHLHLHAVEQRGLIARLHERLEAGARAGGRGERTGHAEIQQFEIPGYHVVTRQVGNTEAEETEML